MSPAAQNLFSLFAFHTIVFCVGASIGVLWRGRLRSLALFVCGLALACVSVWVLGRVDGDVDRLQDYFYGSDGVADFLWAISVFFGGGLLGAFAGYAVKWKLAGPPKPATVSPSPGGRGPG